MTKLMQWLTFLLVLVIILGAAYTDTILSEFRMEIMTIILKLIDKDAFSIEKLKEISQDLLRFKMSISNEIMRMLMLPQATAGKKQQPVGDCSECDVLKEISFKIENLLVCADKEEEAGD